MKLRPTRAAREESSGGNAEAEYYVLGGEHVGVSVARRLRAAGRSVTVIDEAYDADSDEIPGLRGDPRDVHTLEAAGVTDGSTVVVATPSDSRNLLVAQLVRGHFDVSSLHVLVNSPDRYDLFAEVGYEPICATTALSGGVVENLEEDLEEEGQTA